MTNEETIVYINAQTACALIKMEAMKAENMQRQILGQSMAYNEKDFTGLIDKYGIHHNGVLTQLYHL